MIRQDHLSNHKRIVASKRIKNKTLPQHSLQQPGASIDADTGGNNFFQIQVECRHLLIEPLNVSLIVFTACGINHQTTPLSLREKIAFSPSAQASVLSALMQSPVLSEVALLSTCNRTELYCQTAQPQQLLPMLSALCQVPTDVLAPHWYVHTHHLGVKHALRVASGLDSMMLGEPQILGQFKQAYALACEMGTAQSQLKQIFPYVFRASKRIRNQSKIGSSPVSVAYAAAQRILQHFPVTDALEIFVIGSGDTAKLVTKYLYEAGMRRFLVTSRTAQHAEHFAQQYHATVVPLETLSTALITADIVITASTCPVPFITPTLLSTVLPLRVQPALFLLDLAVPRNVTEEVADLPAVTLCNLDELQTVCQVGQKTRLKAAGRAEILVDKALEHFIRWTDLTQTHALICNYRDHMQSLAAKELTNALQQLASGEAPQQILELLTQRLFKKLTHVPTIGLRQAAQAGYTEVLDLIDTHLTTSTA